MTLLLAFAIGLADCHNLKIGNGRNGIYGVFTDDARSQYVAWGMGLANKWAAEEMNEVLRRNDRWHKQRPQQDYR